MSEGMKEREGERGQAPVLVHSQGFVVSANQILQGPKSPLRPSSDGFPAF